MPGLAVMFDTDGLPIPQGHIRTVTKGGRTWSFHGSPGLKHWRARVAADAHAAMVGEAYAGPVHVGLTFWMPRPKDQVNAAAKVKPSAPTYPITRPDLDRLARAVLDAITGPIIRDDSQVVILNCGKVYADPGVKAGVHVFVASLLEDAKPEPVIAVG